MKKHVLVGVAALACSASAMADVTVFGFLEAQVGRAPGSSDTQLFDAGGSRLGFKGDEDLGGGMKASFYLEHRLDPTDGTAGGPFWKGGSWVGLSGDFGAVKLGRWWSQSFLKAQYAADPFGMVSMGLGTFGTAGTGGVFWVDNSVTYENAFGPVSFGVQLGETPTGGTDNPVTVGVSYAAGPLYVGAGFEKSTDGSADSDHLALAANYDFGVAKLFAGYAIAHDAADAKSTDIEFGFSAPVGPGAVIGSFNKRKVVDTVTEQLVSVGYKYNLSKRTNVFAVVANDSKKTSDKTGFALGVFHSF